MKDTDEVKITVGDVRRVAGKGGLFKAFVDELFPQVLELDDVTDRLIVGPSFGGECLSIADPKLKGIGPEKSFVIACLREKDGKIVVVSDCLTLHTIRDGRVYLKK